MNTKEITENAIRNLPKRCELKVGDGYFTVQEIFPVDRIEEENNRLRKWEWEFRESEVAIGGDPNGNLFTQFKTFVWFWDHESNERKKLSESLHEFFHSLKEPEDIGINLDPKNIITGWVDPNFKSEWD